MLKEISYGDFCKMKNDSEYEIIVNDMIKNKICEHSIFNMDNSAVVKLDLFNLEETDEESIRDICDMNTHYCHYSFNPSGKWYQSQTIIFKNESYVLTATKADKNIKS